MEKRLETKQPDIDNHKLMYHPARVAEYLEKKDCFPIYVEIGPTNRCNHRCIFCGLDWVEKGKKDIDKDIMLKTLEDMAKHGVKSVMFAGEGEPLLHRDIGLFVQTAKKYGIDISITTNGIPFSQKKREQCLPYLSWIRFSIDSGSPENYAFIHGTNQRDFYKLMKNIGETVKLKNKEKLETVIDAQFLVIPQNSKELVKLAQRLGDLGVDNLQIKPYSHHPLSNNSFVLKAENYNLLEEELREFNSDDFQIKFRKATAQRIVEGATYDFCYGNSFFALIDAKGNIIPCNLYYNNPEFTYGNLYEDSFSDIWTREKRKEVIKKMDRKGVEGCRKGCRLDVINRYLDRLKNPLPHDNFI